MVWFDQLVFATDPQQTSIQIVALLERLQFLSMQDRRMRLGDKHKGVGSAGLSASDASSMTTSTASGWQISSQMASGMELPAEWMGTWAFVAHVLALDFTPALGAPAQRFGG